MKPNFYPELDENGVDKLFPPRQDQIEFKYEPTKLNTMLVDAQKSLHENFASVESFIIKGVELFWACQTNMESRWKAILLLLTSL